MRDYYRTITNLSDSNETSVRFLCSGNLSGNYEYYQNSYEDLRNKRFVEELDLPLECDENGYFVEFKEKCKWYIEQMCESIYDKKHIYSQANVYKFSKELALSSISFKNIKSLDAKNRLISILGKERIVCFDHPSWLNSQVVDQEISFYFKNKEDYDLIQLIFAEYLL